MVAWSFHSVGQVARAPSMPSVAAQLPQHTTQVNTWWQWITHLCSFHTFGPTFQWFLNCLLISDDEDSDNTIKNTVRDRRREAHTHAEQKRRDAIKVLAASPCCGVAAVVVWLSSAATFHHLWCLFCFTERLWWAAGAGTQVSTAGHTGLTEAEQGHHFAEMWVNRDFTCHTLMSNSVLAH